MQRPRVVLPQPLSPTSPRVSPRRISKSTSSTALTCPTVRPKKPCFMGKCILRCLTSSRTSLAAPLRSAPSVSIRVPLLSAVEQAPDLSGVLQRLLRSRPRGITLAVTDGLARRSEGYPWRQDLLAVALHKLVAAGVEGAARGAVVGVGNHAAD